MRARLVLLGVAAAISAVTLTGCSSTIEGEASLASNVGEAEPSESTDPSESGAPDSTNSPGQSESSEPAVPGQTPDLSDLPAVANYLCQTVRARDADIEGSIGRIQSLAEEEETGYCVVTTENGTLMLGASSHSAEALAKGDDQFELLEERPIDGLPGFFGRLHLQRSEPYNVVLVALSSDARADGELDVYGDDLAAAESLLREILPLLRRG